MYSVLLALEEENTAQLERVLRRFTRQVLALERPTYGERLGFLRGHRVKVKKKDLLGSEEKIIHTTDTPTGTWMGKV